tara:strand:+ start:20 stop:208 length:189 start_codon:yes stop_codon:yes gene_type:complete
MKKETAKKIAIGVVGLYIAYQYWLTTQDKSIVNKFIAAEEGFTMQVNPNDYVDEEVIIVNEN